jgi:hypothetical protein
MSWRLALLELYVPASVRKLALERLFRSTASAFGCTLPAMRPLAYPELLEEFARFTRARAQKLLSAHEREAVRQGLDNEARQLGAKLRSWLGIRTPEEAARALTLVYELLGIEFSITAEGIVGISRCFFSDYYSPEICWVISGLDTGLAAGLTDGGELTFTHRITEGHEACRALLSSGVDEE